MTPSRILILLVLPICLALPLQPSGPGTAGGNILGIPVGARAIAMGEAYTAQADDVSSLYWNPAGLALLNQSQASFTYNQYLQGLSYSQAAVATPLEFGGLGASLSYMTYGQIPGYSISDTPTGNVDAYNGVATLGGAWLGDFWSAGLNVKGIQGSLADVKATGLAADTGLNLIYPKEVLNGTLRFGASVRNMGGGMKYLQENDPFPTEWRLGLAAVQILNNRINLSADYGKERDNDGAIYLGGEYRFGPSLALRAGYADNHTEGSGLRAGIGLNFRDFSFDYAFSDFGELGLAHRYELTYRFGVIRPLLSPEERNILRRGKQALHEGRYSESVLLFNSLIELEPSYRPARRLLKVAMRGVETDDRLAEQEVNPLSLIYAHSKQDTEDLDNLTNLLTLGDTEPRTSQAPKEQENQP
jgi:hypothetical protein